MTGMALRPDLLKKNDSYQTKIGNSNQSECQLSSSFSVSIRLQMKNNYLGGDDRT